jgi:hypothetical protein
MKRVLIEVDPAIHEALARIAARVSKSRSEIIRDALYWTVFEAIEGSGELPKPAPACTAQAPDEKRIRMYNGTAVVMNEWGLIDADQSTAPRTIRSWEDFK